MEEFIALRSKMYSCKTVDGVMKKAKGIQRSIVKNVLTHDNYKESLNQTRTTPLIVTQRNIESHQQILYTNERKKIALAPFDDMRYFIKNNKTLPHGHYIITNADYCYINTSFLKRQTPQEQAEHPKNTP